MSTERADSRHRCLLIFFLWAGCLLLPGQVISDPGLKDTDLASTIGAATLNKRELRIGMGYTHEDKTRFSSDRLIDQSKAYKDFPADIGASDKLRLAVAYGLTDNLTLKLDVPFVWRRGLRLATSISEVCFKKRTPSDIAVCSPEASGVGNTGGLQGLGDVSLLAQQRVIDVEGSDLAGSVIAEIKAPTGSTGDLVEAHWMYGSFSDWADLRYQLGTGSWDFSSGVAISARIGEVLFETSPIFVYSGWGLEGYKKRVRPGNEVRAGVGGIYLPGFESLLREKFGSTGSGRTIHDKWSIKPFVEANVSWIAQAMEEFTDYLDAKVRRRRDDTGGTQVFAAIGVRAFGAEKLQVALSFGLPVYQSLRGDQQKTGWIANFLLAVRFK